MTGEGRRVFVLLAFDATTRCATRPVAVVGLDPGYRAILSWVPLEHVAAHVWADRVAAAHGELADALEAWLASSNGVTTEIVEVPAPPAADPRGAVEIVMDELLVPVVPGRRPGGR